MAPSVLAAGPDQSVVKIFVTKQEYDFAQPWQRNSPERSSGSGCIIDSNRILTCAHVVEFGEFIEVRKARDARKYTATVKYISPEYDLAILEVADSRFFNKATPLPLSGLPAIGERVVTYGFPTGGDELSVTSGIVSRIENVTYTYGDYNNLGVQIDAAINPGNSGGPVMQDGKLAGIAFQGRTQNQGIGYMVPTPVINIFLKDVQDGRYDGPVPLLLKWQKMENPALRRCYSMTDTASGILINSIHPYSAFYGALRPDDVLTEVGDLPVENDGTILMDGSLKTSFETALQLGNLGDTVKLQLLRGGRPVAISIPLKYARASARLVDKIDLRPRYYIEDGFVFTTPSYYYFKGDSYWAYNNPELSYYYYDHVLSADTAGEIVMLASVLPDKSNVGYHDVSNKIIRKVNGRPVRNLTDLIDAFRKTRDTDMILEDEDNSKYVISTSDLEQTTQTILQRYGIRDKMRL